MNFQHCVRWHAALANADTWRAKGSRENACVEGRLHFKTGQAHSSVIEAMVCFPFRLSFPMKTFCTALTDKHNQKQKTLPLELTDSRQLLPGWHQPAFLALENDQREGSGKPTTWEGKLLFSQTGVSLLWANRSETSPVWMIHFGKGKHFSHHADSSNAIQEI